MNCHLKPAGSRTDFVAGLPAQPQAPGIAGEGLGLQIPGPGPLPELVPDDGIAGLSREGIVYAGWECDEDAKGAKDAESQSAEAPCANSESTEDGGQAVRLYPLVQRPLDPKRLRSATLVHPKGSTGIDPRGTP